MIVRSVTGTRASQHLDFIRGLAALLVVLFHVRYWFFVEYRDVQARSVLTRVWYLLTAFGHDAVIIFFVLSGFLIGSVVIRNLISGRWSWTDYLTSRFVRLYVVLIPGLLLTVLWDQLGLHVLGRSSVYGATVYDFIGSGLGAGLLTFIGNLFFLQGIYFPSFGSNLALWSLSYEFWYYMIFPLAALALLSSESRNRRLAFAVTCVLLLCFVGQTIAAYFTLWLLGVGLALLPDHPWLRHWRPNWFVPLAGVAFVTALAVEHLTPNRAAFGGFIFVNDAVTAILFSACLYVVLHDRRAPTARGYGILAPKLASCSFTLYLVHLPALVILNAWLVADKPWLPSGQTIAAGVLLVALMLAYAMAVAAVTEAHTAAIRKAVLRFLAPLKPVSGQLTPVGPSVQLHLEE